jgi:hypothetical protein
MILPNPPLRLYNNPVISGLSINNDDDLDRGLVCDDDIPEDVVAPVVIDGDDDNPIFNIFVF